MMVKEMRSQTGDEATPFSTAVVPSHASTVAYAYHEISEQHVTQVDVLEQLKTNIAQLEDLHDRLRFMMGEVRSLLKKN